MTQQHDGTTPEQGQTPAPDATQQIPNESTQALPHYSYPVAKPQVSGVSDMSVPAAATSVPSLPAGVALADEPTGGSGSGGESRKGLLIGGLAAVLVLGAGGVFAAQKLSGGGAQPADVIPGDAYAYFRLDIDPSAGQKVAAVRFLSKIPEVKENLAGDDMRKKLWESISKKEKCAAKYDYARDIEPWLGDRLGVALRPGGTDKEVNTVAALQVKDADKARSTIVALAECGKGSDDVDIVTKNGYVLFTNKGQGNATLAAIDKGSLASNATFSKDMTDLGSDGILSMWVDGAPFLKDASKMAKKPFDVPADFQGRFAGAVRFDPSYIEVAGITRGVEGAKSVQGNGTELANLPADTLAAIHVAGADTLIGENWNNLKQAMDGAAKSANEGSADDMLKQLEDELDIKLPDDLKTLFGSQLTMAVPGQQFDAKKPKGGLKIVSTDAKKADELIGKFEDLAGASGFLTHKVTGDKVYVATTPDYADDLEAGGRLGESDVFKAALGDVSKTNLAIYVDLDKVEKNYLSEVPRKQRPGVEALRAVGLNVSMTDAGEGSFSLRIVSN